MEKEYRNGKYLHIRERNCFKWYAARIDNRKFDAARICKAVAATINNKGGCLTISSKSLLFIGRAFLCCELQRLLAQLGTFPTQKLVTKSGFIFAALVPYFHGIPCMHPHCLLRMFTFSVLLLPWHPLHASKGLLPMTAFLVRLLPWHPPYASP